MLPLEGITVIAVEQAVAAPFCSSRLADAGAHVIKVERPEGDFARGYDAAAKGQSSYFVWLNRGKDSVVIDLATKEGRQNLEELIARSRDGKGADIRISMFDVMADWLSVPLLNAQAGNPPERMGLAHPSIAPYGVFRSKDGRDILISIQSEREWKKLCAEVLSQPELPDDVRFSNMVERVRNRKLTDQTVGDIFATMTRNELLQRLSDADIAF